MKNKLGQIAYDYLMKKSGEMITLSEQIENKQQSYELNLIGSALTQFANEFKETCKTHYDNIENVCSEVKEHANKICGIADNLDLTYGDSETAESLDRIESSILSSIEKLDE